MSRNVTPSWNGKTRFLRSRSTQRMTRKICSIIISIHNFSKFSMKFSLKVSEIKFIFAFFFDLVHAWINVSVVLSLKDWSKFSVGDDRGINLERLIIQKIKKKIMTYINFNIFKDSKFKSDKKKGDWAQGSP